MLRGAGIFLHWLLLVWGIWYHMEEPCRGVAPLFWWILLVKSSLDFFLRESAWNLGSTKKHIFAHFCPHSTTEPVSFAGNNSVPKSRPCWAAHTRLGNFQYPLPPPPPPRDDLCVHKDHLVKELSWIFEVGRLFIVERGIFSYSLCRFFFKLSRHVLC